MKNALLGLLLLTDFSFKLSAADDADQTLVYHSDDKNFQYTITKAIDDQKETITIVSRIRNINPAEPLNYLPQPLRTTILTQKTGKTFKQKKYKGEFTELPNHEKTPIKNDEAKRLFNEYDKLLIDESGKINRTFGKNIKSARN